MLYVVYKQLHVVLIDFVSFFESIHHDHLVEKMLRANIYEQLIRVFIGFYKNAKSTFWLRDEFVESFSYISGLR